MLEDGILGKNKDYELKRDNNLFVKMFYMLNPQVQPYLNEFGTLSLLQWSTDVVDQKLKKEKVE